MRTLRILAVLIFLCLSVVARPAIAGDVTVDRVVAAQFSFGYFIAVVVARDGGSGQRTAVGERYRDRCRQRPRVRDRP